MNDHVAEPFRTILNNLAGPKPSLQNQAVAKRVQNRERFRVVEQVHAELEAAGVVIDIAQLDWAAKEINDRLYEASLNAQFHQEQEREAAREERRQYREYRNDSGV